jgi:hypothetical protein
VAIEQLDRGVEDGLAIERLASHHDHLLTATATRYDARMGKTLLIAFVLVGCTEHGQTPDQTPRDFYERNVAPALAASCSGNTSGCHNQAGIPPQFEDQDTSYDAVVPRFTGDFTTTAALLPADHFGIVLNPAVQAKIDEWFALERGE